MSLQGPLIVVAEQPAPGLVAALGAAGAFPIVETKWADAPTAFVSVKPAGVVIAEPGPSPSESAARMLCLQIATVDGPIVPTIALSAGDTDAAIPVALSFDAALPPQRLIARLQSAMRVRALHATVLRRLDLFDPAGKAPTLPKTDPLDDATVLIAGRGPLYPTLTVAMGERVKMVGALSVDNAARHLSARDIDGVVVGDGFSPRMVEDFLTMLAENTQFRELPVTVIGEAPADLLDALPNIDQVAGDATRIVARMLPMLRLHAFAQRLKRMLASIDAGGILDVETGLLTGEAFWRDLEKAAEDAGDRSQPLSVGRFAFDGLADPRASLDAARLLVRLVRSIDFATRETDGALLMAFTQTDLREAHVIARRIAGTLKSAVVMAQSGRGEVTVHLTLGTLKAGDTLDSLMLRVNGNRMVAAE